MSMDYNKESGVLSKIVSGFYRDEFSREKKKEWCFCRNSLHLGPWFRGFSYMCFLFFFFLIGEISGYFDLKVIKWKFTALSDN
jgi:hypothetical protein